MYNWNTLIQAIESVIRDNDNQEITGTIMQSILKSVVTNVGGNPSFGTVVGTADAPMVSDGPLFYIAVGKGKYTNFGNVEVTTEMAVLCPVNDSWVAYGIDLPYGLKSDVDNKVDKVSGKQLSTNDYTTDEKTKLAGIETGANKTTKLSQLQNDTNFVNETQLATKQDTLIAGENIELEGANIDAKPFDKVVKYVSDDAAREILGGDWRMPSYIEARELRDNCTIAVETVNGVIGCRITGTNGNSIFVPYSGYQSGTWVDTTTRRAYLLCNSLRIEYYPTTQVYYDTCFRWQIERNADSSSLSLIHI